MARFGYREVGGKSIPNRGNRPREGTEAYVWPYIQPDLGHKVHKGEQSVMLENQVEGGGEVWFESPPNWELTCSTGIH